jgi:hypothetical protein
MDRRAFLTKTLLSGAIIAAMGGTALALPSVAPRDAIAPEGPVETVWWRRWHWRRWHWRRWRRW